MVAIRSSSWPGRKRQSTLAVARLRDDVVLVAGVQHRHVGGVLQRAPHEPRRPAEVARAARRGPRRRQLVAGELADSRRAAAHRGDVLARPLVRVDPRDRLGQADDRVLVVGDRAVPGAAVGAQPQPGDALLGGLQQVGAGRLAVAVGDGDAVAADLADRLGHARRTPRGGRRPPSGCPGRRRPPRRRRTRTPGRAAARVPVRARWRTARQHHRVHVLHVDRAAAPDAPVALLPGERVDRPVGGVGRHDVEVAVHAQRRRGRGRRPRCARRRWPGRARSREVSARGPPRSAAR